MCFFDLEAYTESLAKTSSTDLQNCVVSSTFHVLFIDYMVFLLTTILFAISEMNSVIALSFVKAVIGEPL